jgi:hypothetical protein
MTRNPQPQVKTLGTRRIARNPDLESKLKEMALPLAPLVQLTTGRIHPAFPAHLLNFWLLTDDQLEALASFYHQRTPCQWTNCYPCPIRWSPDLSLEQKRRKIGEFIGLKGCETPVGIRTEEEITEDARRARLAKDEELFRRKMDMS